MPFTERPRIQEPEHYQDKHVRFSIAHCDTDQYCILKLQKDELEALCKRLGMYESMTWGTFVQMPHEKGLSVDKRDGVLHQMLSRRMPGISTFGHFRVTGTESNMRVFVGRERDLARILLIDRKGELQH